MRKTTKVTVLGGVTAALTLTLIPSANADLQPRPNDIVGVGSDTVQFVGDFMADGTAGGLAGFNATAVTRRLANFDATSDGAGGTAFTSSGAVAAPKIIARAGQKPQTRPAGSGAGVTALQNDDGIGGVNQFPNNTFNFSRSSALRSCSSLSSAQIPGGVHVYQIASDALQLAVTPTSHAPNLTLADMTNIYNGTYDTWSDIPGYSGAFGGNAIVPAVPQAGSGTRGDFLQSVLGSPTATPTSRVLVTEEHDPAPIANFVSTPSYLGGGPATKDDVIGPFSTGRWNLYDTGYFNATGATNNSGVVLQGGASLTAAPAGVWWVGRKLYIFVRENDVNSTTGWQAGSSQNFVQALFKDNASGLDGFFFRPANAPIYTAAGVVRDYVDLGVAASGSVPQNCL